MQEEGLRSVFKNVQFNDLIIDSDQRTYHPYTTNAYDNSDEIRLIIQKGDLVTATYDSVIYIEGTIAATDAAKAHDLTNNAPLFLFEEIRYVLGDQTVDTCRLPGITSAMKGYVSYTAAQSKGLSHAGWSPGNAPLQISPDKKNFSASIPLRHVLGFAEGHRRPIVNMRQELILIRSKNDVDCYAGETEVKISVTKVLWKVSHIIPSDSEKLELYNKINTDVSIPIAFHGRDLNVYLALSASKSVVWAVKSSIGAQRPQWMLCGFQEKKRDNKAAIAADFSQVNITNIKANINNK